MRTLLLRPPRRDATDRGLPVPPLGLATLAGALRARGRPVEVLDAYALGWSWSRMVQEVARRRPDVLGLGAMTPVADVAERAARLLRPHVGTIVLGGPHPTALGSAALDACPAWDHVVVGEGDEVIGPYLDWLERGGAPPPGVGARGWPLVEHRPVVPLDELPLPAHDLLPLRAYRYLLATRPGFATMVTSRGCPFRCSFCDKSVSGSRWRARSAVSVVDELELLSRRHGVGFVALYDDNFTLRRSRVVSICEEILRRGLDVHWKCEGRVDGVDVELLRLMRRAGCRLVAYGVESGNQRSLELLRKDVTLDDTRAAFAATREAGVQSLAYIILGVPGEGVHEVRHTVRFVHELGADWVQFASLAAYPSTSVTTAGFRVAEDQVRSPVDSDAHRAVLTDLPAPVLARELRDAWWGFYARPHVAARLARNVVRSGAWRESLRLGGALWASRAG